MITMTISVKILKNKPSIPQPNGLRPFMPAITAHTIAAMMLPIATNPPLIPFRMKSAAWDRFAPPISTPRQPRSST
jgi:hypothetical protein